VTTNFPSSIDAFTNPTSADTLDNPPHDQQHADINDAMEAVQTSLLDGAPLYIDDANERVGIGTQTPRTPLEIQGTSSGSVDEVLLLAADGNQVAGSGARLHLSGGNATQRSAYVEGVNTSGTTNAHALTFGTSAGGSDPVERMRITASGNVGINDTTPSYTLDVNGDINSQTDVLVSGTSLPRGLLANFDTQGDFTIGSSYTDIGSISFTLSEQRQILLTAFIPLWQSFSSSTGITVVYMTSGPASSPGTFYQGAYQSMGSGNHCLSIQRMITLNAATYTFYLVGLRTVGTAEINGGSNIRRTTFSAIDMGGT